MSLDVKHGRNRCRIVCCEYAIKRGNFGEHYTLAYPASISWPSGLKIRWKHFILVSPQRRKHSTSPPEAMESFWSCLKAMNLALRTEAHEKANKWLKILGGCTSSRRRRFNEILWSSISYICRLLWTSELQDKKSPFTSIKVRSLYFTWGGPNHTQISDHIYYSGL